MSTSNMLSASANGSGVLIIAPHSHCESSEYRDCDTVAKIAVKALREIDKDGLIIREHLADRLRALGDYNRPVTDGDEWRIRARAIAEKMAPAFVLEVHSFPGKHDTFATAWPGADLVLFRSKANAPWIGQLAETIQANAKEFKVMVADPWHPCAISDDMATLGLRHTLVEFNEDMPRSNIGPLAKAVLLGVGKFIGKGGVSGGNANGSSWAMALMMVLAIAIILYMRRSGILYQKNVAIGRTTNQPLFHIRG